MNYNQSVAFAPSRTRRSRTAGMVGLALGVLLALGLAYWGISSRLRDATALKITTDAAAVPIVAVTKSVAGPEIDTVVLPGTVRAYLDTPIFARTSGYVSRWYTDIGTRVKAGQLLAEIDAPEVNHQLNQASADVVNARENSRLAQITAKRYGALVATDDVSRQFNDEKVSDAAAKAALVASNEANAARLKQMVDFQKVVAPYDGIVTARQVDVGDLINAGAGAGTKLFSVADTSKLRIYVQVPQSYAAAVKVGVTGELHFPEHPGRVFTATVVRTSGALDPAARTLLVELQYDNAKGELLPGGYTEVHLQLPVENRGVHLPANTLLFRAEGPRIATVGSDGAVTLHAVTVGRDFGRNVEIVAGLSPDEQVILNPPASLRDGDIVHITKAAETAQPAAPK
jgi:RND family efflux transporter MFP subunit